MTEHKVILGDCIEMMQKHIPDNSVDCVMTSPPYWGLRDYGAEGQYGLEKTPEQFIQKMVEVFREVKRVLKQTGSVYLNLGDTYYGGSGCAYDAPNKVKNEQRRELMITDGWKQPKQLCMIPARTAIALQDDGWILRNDIIWHKPNPMPSSVKDRLNTTYEHIFHFVKQRKYYYDLDAIRKPHKNPEDVAYRKELRVGKEYDTKEPYKNNTPYSVQPRDKEFVEYRNLPDLKELASWLNMWRKEKGYTIDEIEEKMDSQAPHHWFNAESYPSAEDWKELKEILEFDNTYDKVMTEIFTKPAEKQDNPLGKNPGDFWEITTQPFPEAHFATYPEKLCEKPIKSSCPEQICKKCGFIRERIVEVIGERVGSSYRPGEKYEIGRPQRGEYCNNYKTIGWSKCDCNTDFEPGTVLDPFAGAFTTALVAKKLGRNSISIELKKDYWEKIGKKRLQADYKHLGDIKFEVK